MRRPSCRWLTLWFFIASTSPSHFHAQQTPPAVSTITYPNNGEGLRELLDNMLAFARKGQTEQLRSMIRSLEIPNYETWFTKNFGQEKGENWAEAYGKRLTRNEEDFEELIVKLAHMMASLPLRRWTPKKV